VRPASARDAHADAVGRREAPDGDQRGGGDPGGGGAHAGLLRGGGNGTPPTLPSPGIACPLNLLAGADDHITPPDQVFALADVASTPAEAVVRRTTPGGHLGLLMGHQALREHWPVPLDAVHARSVR